MAEAWTATLPLQTSLALINYYAIYLINKKGESEREEKSRQSKPSYGIFEVTPIPTLWIFFLYHMGPHSFYKERDRDHLLCILCVWADDLPIDGLLGVAGVEVQRAPAHMNRHHGGQGVLIQNTKLLNIYDYGKISNNH